MEKIIDPNSLYVSWPIMTAIQTTIQAINPQPENPPNSPKSRLLANYRKVRSASENMCAPLQTEDYVIQSMADVSPPKWHLGHTTWFFEAIILKNFDPDYKNWHDDFDFIFNSYYESLGERVPRFERGLLFRPPVKEVYGYRQHVDAAIARLDGKLQENGNYEKFSEIMTIGCHHEQQHQELLMMDIKYNFFKNPLMPAYYNREREEAGAGRQAKTNAQAKANAQEKTHAKEENAPPSAAGSANGRPADGSSPLKYLPVEGGLYPIGYSGSDFHYDNEGPAHQVYLQDFAIAERPVTCGEYLQFIEAGGYQDFRHWLSDGWAWVQKEKRSAPLYWLKREGQWHIFTLAGLQPLKREEPLCHVNFYEASAFASWQNRRLPTEAEWETAFLQYHPNWREAPAQAHFANQEIYHPQACSTKEPCRQMFGDVWEWTSSAYLPYPGFQAAEGALGEYNGKFMSGQMVLKGGCCATPTGHIRPSYRNFFYPFQSWQFSGLRLAQDG